MIESVEFHNFKSLRNTTLPLSRFTLIVGPNGSGKSTAMQAIQAAGDMEMVKYHRTATAGLQKDDSNNIEVVIHWGEPYAGAQTHAIWLTGDKRSYLRHNDKRSRDINRRDSIGKALEDTLAAVRIYSFDGQAIAAPSQLKPKATLVPSGANLAVVLDRLRDEEPEILEALNEELGRWLPEFDRILFETPITGHRAITLRTREGHHKIPATELSQGTLIAIAILTLAYIPDPPPIICIEEPDRGIHPRLLRDVRDALYRLAYPESVGEKRAPVQVIATTHSPYLLDLFRDHPEEIVIANKIGQEAGFKRLTDQKNIDEILEDAHLGDIWYTGILGGVPSNT
ncbi:MAG: ATP-binding protein [Blastocatellia bacterium]